MKKLLMTLLLTFCIGCTYTLLNEKDTTVFAKSTKETIMIDAGHGGYDVGSISNYNDYEKDINLDIALLVGKQLKSYGCNGVQREHNKKLNNGLPILHKVPPKRDYGRYFCIMAEKGGTSHGGLTEKLSPFFHAKKQEVNAYGR